MKIVGVLVLLAVAPGFGQVVPAAVQTVAPVGARFEVIQSVLAARETFKLDKYSGVVYLLMSDHDGMPFWSHTTWSAKPDVGAGNWPRFQIFLGGQRVSDAFLLDLSTGKTWVWAIVGGENESAWIAMKDAFVVKTPGYLPEPPATGSTRR